MTSSFTLPSKHVRSFPTANTIMLTYTVYRFFPEQEHFVHLLGTERCVLCGIRAAVGAGVWTKGTHFSVGRAHSPPAKQRANVFFLAVPEEDQLSRGMLSRGAASHAHVRKRKEPGGLRYGK